MKPPIPAAVANLAALLRDDIAPNLTGFRAGNAGMMAAMFDMVAEEWDRAAARLVAENAAFRALLQRGGVTDDLGDDSDLRVSALEAGNERLRALLTELHAKVETRGDAEARSLDAAIWDALRTSVENRRIASANF
jgi:hypothetical protein